MIDSLSPLNYGRITPAARSAAAAKVKEEFLVIFYKELLKQVFKSPELSMGEEKDNSNNFVSSFNSDLMVEQMAQLMVQKSFANMPNFLPLEEVK
jgi:hypothetical protein